MTLIVIKSDEQNIYHNLYVDMTPEQLKKVIDECINNILFTNSFDNDKLKVTKPTND